MNLFFFVTVTFCRELVNLATDLGEIREHFIAHSALFARPCSGPAAVLRRAQRALAEPPPGTEPGPRRVLPRAMHRAPLPREVFFRP